MGNTAELLATCFNLSSLLLESCTTANTCVVHGLAQPPVLSQLKAPNLLPSYMNVSHSIATDSVKSVFRYDGMDHLTNE